MSGIIIGRPRSAIRQVLTEPTQRAKLTGHLLHEIDEILQKPEDQWSQREFHFLWHCGARCDD